MVTFKIKTLLTLVFSVFITVLQAQKNGFKLYDAKTLETLAFAHITFKPLKSSKIFNIISDEYGSVELPLGISGEVAVSISYIGYISLIKTINLDRISSLYLFPVIEDIGDVVVTANTGSATTQESIYNIDVIDKEEIENKSANTLADLLSSNEKIEIQYDVLGANISMQGLSGANIKVMIDGVPVIGRLNGEIDLSKINLNNIERVEIVEGPLSVIYGSNALAGVINLISKKTQKDKLNTEINTFYQSIGNYNIDASVSLKIKRHLISLSGGRYFFKGWDEVEVIRDFSWDPKETYFSELSYSYRSKKDWFHRIKASYFQDRLLDRKDPFGPFAKADDVWYKTRKLDFSYNLNGSFKENYYLKSTNAYNNYQRIKNTLTKDLNLLETTLKENSGFNSFQDTTSLHQVISRTSVAYSNKESKYNYQFGYDFSYESGKGKRFYDEKGNSVSIFDLVAFVSFTYKPSSKISIQPAVRYGYNSKFTSIPTFSTSFKYDITKNLIWRISYGMGYRAPTLKEMYLDFQDINHNIQGNEDLKAEKSHNISTNIDWKASKNLHHVKLNLNGFFNHKYDGIVLSQNLNSTDVTSYNYQNAYIYQTLGFNMNVFYNFKGLEINPGISYIGTYNAEVEENKDLNQFFFKPSIKLNINYKIEKWGLRFSLFNKYTGNYSDYFIDENDTFIIQKLEAYNMLDLTAGKSFWKKRITVNLGVKNIFDIKSINNSSSNGGTHSSSSGTMISTGRSYFIGLKLKYIK